jgi:glutamate synthase (NADPH/NADH) large chain
LDTQGDFHRQCNLETFELEQLSPTDEDDVRVLIEKHQRLTGSTVAARLLKDWANEKQSLIKVMPSDYKRVLEAQQALLKTSNIG